MATYETYFVTYLDIVGFRALIKNLSPEKVGQLRDTLRTALQSMSVRGKGVPSVTSYRFKMFSDSIAMSVLSSRVLALQFLLHIAKFQGSLASEGLFLRGGIVCGDHFEDAEVLFGPALIHAVDLERDIAIWPRVVVHPDVVGMCRVDEASSSSGPVVDSQIDILLRKDSDGITYLNYIRIFHESFDSAELAGQFLRNHRNHIQGKVREASQELKILAKYYWLATYHNSEMAELNRCDLQIDMHSAFPGL